MSNADVINISRYGHGRDVSERWCVLLISSKCAHL